MKKIITSIRKAETWLAHFGADRYLHLLAGLIITFIVALLVKAPVWEAGLIGLGITVIVGWLKEIADSITGELGDVVDWLFTVIGGVIAYALLMLTTL